MEIYSISIFDPSATAPEERSGPLLLDNVSSATGGRLFRVDDVDEMSDIAEKISTELRNQYVIGYKPKNLSRDGKWRKVKVKVNPPRDCLRSRFMLAPGTMRHCSNAVLAAVLIAWVFSSRPSRLRRREAQRRPLRPRRSPGTPIPCARPIPYLPRLPPELFARKARATYPHRRR